MTYLICKKCGKQYPLPEGKESFNYENCTCGGKLVYSPMPSPMPQMNPIPEQGNTKGEATKYYVQRTPQPEGVNWRGVFAGLSFLFITLILGVMMIFGENLPTKPSDVPSNLLIGFSALTIALTFLAGFISAFLSGSKKFSMGAVNGGMVGIIVGVLLGFAGGVAVFISGTILFGLLSLIGGVMGILPRKFSKRQKKVI